MYNSGVGFPAKPYFQGKVLMQEVGSWRNLFVLITMDGSARATSFISWIKLSKTNVKSKWHFFSLLEHFNRWMRKVTIIPDRMAQFKKCWHHQNIVSICEGTVILHIKWDLYHFVCASQCLFTYSVHSLNFNWVFYNMVKINGLLQAPAILSKSYNRPQTCNISLFLTNQTTQFIPSLLHIILWVTLLSCKRSPCLLTILMFTDPDPSCRISPYKVARDCLCDNLKLRLAYFCVHHSKKRGNDLQYRCPSGYFPAQ